MLLLNEQQIRECVQLESRALEVVEQAFVSLARGEAIVPAPLEFHLPDRNGEVHVKTAYLRGLPSYALKIASGFYGNSAQGLPNSSGLMVVLSAETGFPQALLLDNGYLTDVRTAMSGAIAAKYMARRYSEVVGIVGVGIQARFQLQALMLVRRIRRVLVYGRKPAAVQRYCEEMTETLGIKVAASPTVSALVRAADIVVTTTPSRIPLVMPKDLHPGLHITAMGADLPGKQELHPQVLARANRLVCDRVAQCAKVGELQHALARRTVKRSKAVELGDVIAGTKPGRRDDSEITVCDLTGVGVQDTAIALLAYQRALAGKLGTTLPQ